MQGRGVAEHERHSSVGVGMPGGTFGAPDAEHGYALRSLDDVFAPARAAGAWAACAMGAVGLLPGAVVFVSRSDRYFLFYLSFAPFAAIALYLVWLFRVFNAVRAFRFQPRVSPIVATALAFVPFVNFVVATAALAHAWKQVTGRSALVAVAWEFVWPLSATVPFVEYATVRSMPPWCATLLWIVPFAGFMAACAGCVYVILAMSKATRVLAASPNAEAR